MKNMTWELEHNGKKVRVVTTDRDGHTARCAWQKGHVFFKGAPGLSEFKVTQVDKVVTA